MKTSGYIVEPSIKEYQIQLLVENESIKIETDDLIFMVKNEGEIVGFAKFIPISNKGHKSKALLLKQFMCLENKAAYTLLSESLMHTWEIGYKAVFSTLSDKVLLETGFERIDAQNCSLPFKQSAILGISLTWNGLASYVSQQSMA